MTKQRQPALHGARLACLVGALCGSGNAAAEEPVPLEQIVVTAQYARMRVVPPAVELDADAIELRAPRLLSELFRGLPGVSLRPNSRGESIVRVRGSEERQTSVFLDGAPLVVPWDGRVDLGLLPPGMISSISVTKGATPVEYGANSVAGVVDLRTTAPGEPGSRIEAAADAGSLGWRALSALGSRVTENSALLLAGAHLERDAEPIADLSALPYSQRDDERRANTDLDSNSLFGAYAATLGGTTLRASLLHVDASRGIAPEAHLDPSVDQPRYWRYPDWTLTQLTAAADTPLASLGRLRFVAWQQWFDQTIDAYRDDTYSTLRSSEQDDDLTYGARATFSRDWTDFTWRLNASTSTSTHEQVDSAVVDGSAVAEPERRYRQRLASLGTELDWQPRPGVAATIGIGRDHAETPLTGDKPAQPDSSATALSAALRVEPAEGWRVTFSSGSRTRFASARELFGESLGRFLPNPALQPETAWLSDLGIDWQGERATVQAGAFYVRGRDTIAQRVVVVAGRSLRQRINLEGTRQYGLDLCASYALSESLRLELSGAWLEAHALEDNGLPGWRLPQRPRHEVGGALEWRASAGSSARIELRHTGEAIDLDAHGDARPLPSSTEINLRGRWILWQSAGGHSWSLTAAVDNLTNAVITPQLGLPLPGRTLRIGLQLD